MDNKHENAKVGTEESRKRKATSIEDEDEIPRQKQKFHQNSKIYCLLNSIFVWLV